MKNLALVALVALATPALAGEKYLGAIVSSDGTERTNATTGTPVKIAQGSKLTLNCTIAVNVCVDTTTACTALGGANPGVPVASSTNFPTSTSQAGAPADTSGTASNGGSILRVVGAAAFTCYVWSRNGNE